jgi:serine/threonine-protein kinase HipA
MTALQVWLDRSLVGHLRHAATTNRFAFDYDAAWLAQPRAHPISPRLPLSRDPAQTDEGHSTEVRQFFENLLPEGDALDHAARANGLSRSNLVGLVIALGRETAGALRIVLPPHDVLADAGAALRPLTPDELSLRIRQRDAMPFSVWDGRVRLSIAGDQDKIAVLERDGQWWLVDDPALASTVIVKPAPERSALSSLPAVEHLCMELAHAVGLPVARTRLVHVPEPVLLVQRFDRVDDGERVRRLHVIDACQALGLPVSLKVERPYGDSAAVRHLRDGCSLPRLFSLTALTPAPAAQRLALLRWLLFQVLVGNTDAHGKNISFFCGPGGLTLAPAYDIACLPALASATLDLGYAMAIGDAFSEPALTPFEWASFAHDCGVPARMLARELQKMAEAMLAGLPAVMVRVQQAGVTDDVCRRVDDVVTTICRRQAALAPAIEQVEREHL